MYRHTEPFQYTLNIATPPDTDLHCKDLDSVAVDDQLPVLDFHGSLEPPVGGIILEQVGLHTQVTETYTPDS